MEKECIDAVRPAIVGNHFSDITTQDDSILSLRRWGISPCSDTRNAQKASSGGSILPKEWVDDKTVRFGIPLIKKKKHLLC